MNRFLIALAIFVTGFSCKAQPPTQLSTTNKKASKAYDAAMTCAQNYDYDCAFKQLDIAKKEDPNFMEAYALAGELYMSEREWAKAIPEFKKSFELNPNMYVSNYFDCGNAELKLGRYADAKIDFQVFLAKNISNSPNTIAEAKQGIADCDFATNAIANPVAFNPINMGENINTSGCEYFPNVTADDGTFLFTRNRQEKNAAGIMTMTQEDFYVSYKNVDGTWSLAQSIGPPINTPQNEGAPSLSTDGRFLFFAACEDENGYGG